MYLVANSWIGPSTHGGELLVKVVMPCRCVDALINDSSNADMLKKLKSIAWLVRLNVSSSITIEEPISEVVALIRTLAVR